MSEPKAINYPLRAVQKKDGSVECRYDERKPNIEAAAEAAHVFIQRNEATMVWQTIPWKSANVFIKRNRRALARAVLKAVEK